MPLLPQPATVTPGEGTFALAGDSRLFLPPDIEDPEFMAARRVQEAFRETFGAAPQLDRLGQRGTPKPGDILLSIADEPTTEPGARDAYTLEVTAERIAIRGASKFGLLNGLRTLEQWVRAHPEGVPAVSIDDQPAFPYRGLHLDVSRGRVPKVSSLKWLIDYLAQYKANMFQLYVEHPFEFRFDPEIAQNDDGLTSEDILELAQYCADRRIDFVPSIQSFGHMGGVLSLPQYRHLADVELEGTWEELTWYQRMTGATINMRDRRALALLGRMHDEYIPLFDSEFVNFSADETYALGKGKNAEEAERIGVGNLYLEHIDWLNEQAKRYGRRMMFWGDIVLKHPENIPDIPKDTILLHWGYSPNTHYERSKEFAEAGLDFFVCPGTNGWNRLLNNVEWGDVNIRRFAAAGEKYGALGVLNTDWGDHGHINPMASSLHGFALGAAMAWNVGEPGPEAFDRIWTTHVFDTSTTEVIQSLRDQSVGLSNWVAFYWPFQVEPRYSFHSMDGKTGARLMEEGEKGVELFSRYVREGIGPNWIAEELLLGSKLNVLAGRKALLLERWNAAEGAADEALAADLRTFADDLEAALQEIKRVWLIRNRPSAVQDILDVLEDLVTEARAMADGPAGPETQPVEKGSGEGEG
ncbi:MAG: glycoside hydrolase family 20 zincin-like fold domain-containing protein [Sumerlaeia bacterium]